MTNEEHRALEELRLQKKTRNAEKRANRSLQARNFQVAITERAAYRREMIEMRVRTDLANAEAAATKIEPTAPKKVAGLGLTEARASLL